MHKINFVSKTMLALKIIGSVILLSILVYAGIDVLLLGFAGLLVAVFFRALSDWLNSKTNIGDKFSLTIVMLSCAAICVAFYFFAAPSVSDQVDQLTETLPKSFQNLQATISEHRWAAGMLEGFDAQKIMGGRTSALNQATGAVSSFLTWVANLLIIFFLGIYLAIEPQTYKNGFLRLIPRGKQNRYEEVLTKAYEALSWWLVGKFFGMTVIGVLTTVGLSLLSVPLALILGIIAALFTFIPNIGPILSAIPAVLLGLTIGTDTAIHIALLYLGVQTIESYFLTPLVQRRTVELPPALTLLAQVLMGVLFGGLGVALATPIMAVMIVVVRMLYVEDALGKLTIAEKVSAPKTGFSPVET